MEIKSVSLAKRIRNGEGFETVYPLSVSPTVSKFGEGRDRIQLIVSFEGGSKVYVSLKQMEDFCKRVSKLIDTLEIGYSLLGEEKVVEAINRMYERRKTVNNSMPQVIEVNGVRGIVKDGKFIPLDMPEDIETV